MTKLAFVGDSIVADGSWQDWFPEDEVWNSGVAGNTTEDLIARLSDVIQAEPDTIALLIGTNDLAWRFSVEHVVRNTETILVSLRRELPDTRILVQSVLPREPEFSPYIAEINRHLWQFAPTIRAGFLDLWPAFAKDDELNPEYSNDRLSLNAAGYDVWLEVLRPALEELAKQPPITRSLPIITDQYARPSETAPHQWGRG